MLKNVWITFIGAALLLMSELALAQAATVANLQGTAQALPGAGAPRTLKQGDTVNQGETVSTGANSSIVLTFQDGQVVALTANSRLAVNTYSYNKEKPAESNVLLNLAQGGMRAITGLIGKARPTAVAYRAGNATIGIRGTDLEVGVGGDDLYVIAKEGAAQVSIPATRTGYAPMSGQMFGMSLPVAVNDADGPIQLAQATTFSVTQEQGFVRIQGINRSLSPDQIRTAVANALGLKDAAAQANSPQFSQIVNAIVNTLVQQLGVPAPSGQSQAPASFNVGNPTGSPRAGAGGGTPSLPACSSISPVTAQRPGVNCS